MTQDKIEKTVEDDTHADESWVHQLEEAGESQAREPARREADRGDGSNPGDPAEGKAGMISEGDDPQTGEDGLGDVDGAD